MANEQTSVPLFVADTILTAAQQNISAGTGVPVFATTVTRDAAFGGANKTLAEGQLCYLSSTNVVQYYDGAAWATVGPASAGALTFISSTSFTTAASVSLPVATFSATYLNYLVLFNLSAASTSPINLTGRLRIAGADNTTSQYSTMLTGFQGDNTAQNVGNTGQSSFTLKTTNTNPNLSARFDFFNVFTNNYTHILTQIASVNPGVATVGSSGSLMFDAVTSFDSFSIIASTGTITGTVKVYGYANS